MKKCVSFALVLVLTLSMTGCFRRREEKPTEPITMPTGNYTTQPATHATAPSSRPTEPATQATAPAATATMPTQATTIPGITDGTTDTTGTARNRVR
jgi:hypothetical protein